MTYTVEPLNIGHIGFVGPTVLSLLERLSLSQRPDHGTLLVLLCMEVVLISESPLTEVLLYIVVCLLICLFFQCCCKHVMNSTVT